MSVGAWPSTASLRAIRRSMVSSGVPSPRRSARQRVGDRGEQRRAWPAPPSSATNSQGRVWCGAGAVQAAATASAHRSRGTVPSPNDRIVAPRVQRLHGRLAEQVELGRDGPGRARSPPSPSHGEPANQRRGDALRLAHHRARRGRDLIGERDHRRVEQPAAVVRRAAEVDDRRHARHPDRDVDEPVAPGPPERVGDHDPEPLQRPPVDQRASAAGRPTRPDPRAAGSAARPRRWRHRHRRSRRRTRAGSRRSPGRRAAATTRTVSPAIAASRSAAGTSRPSCFETTFWVTTTTSPSRTSSAGSSRAARSSPGPISGRPGTGMTSSVTRRAPAPRGRRLPPARRRP